MTFKEALKKAKESGYETPYHWEPVCIPEVVLLDPKFFEALGKTIGWKKIVIEQARQVLSEGKDHQYHPVFYSRTEPKDTEEWLYQWHRFIDHLAEGKSIEEFFEKL